jgi:hypothetical protein
MYKEQLQWQGRRPTGGQWHHPALNVVHRLKTLCRVGTREPSFEIIRVSKISSATAPFMIRRKPLPWDSPCHEAHANLKVPSSGLSMSIQPPPRVPGPQPAPAAIQRGLVADAQGGWEYRSVYRMGTANPSNPAPGYQGQPFPGLTSGRNPAFQARSGPANPKVSLDNPATAECYIPFCPHANNHLPSDAWLRPGENPGNLTLKANLRNATSNIPSGTSTTAEFAKYTSPASTPLRPNPAPKALTLPKAACAGHPTTPEVPDQVSEQQGRRQPRPMIAEHRPPSSVTPCNWNLPLIVVTPAAAPAARSRPAASTDGRGTLPSQRATTRGCDTGLKIVRSDMMHAEVTRGEPHAARTRCRPTLKRQPGSRSLRQDVREVGGVVGSTLGL